MEKKGYLTESSPELPQETCAFWNNQGIDVKSLSNVLREKPICIEFIGSQTQDIFMQAFSEIGIKTGESGVLKLIVTDNYEQDALQQINQDAIAANQPWMLVKPNGVELWIGPVFMPGKTGCWECLQQRLYYNRQVNVFYKAQKNTQGNARIPVASLPLSLQIAANQTAIEIAKWLYFEKNDSLEGKIITFDTRSFTSQSHILVKRPQCKICGDLDKPEPGPVILRKKSSYCANSIGGYREISHEDTLKKYEYHVSPVTGVVQKLKPYWSIENTPIYNYLSGRNIAFQSKSLFWLNSHLRNSTGGKGKSWAQAKAGALCESVERYSGTYHGEEYYIVSSLNELGNKGIHPNTCMNFSENQFQTREEVNRICEKFHFLVPVPFDESLKMHWTPVYSLTEQNFKYLPSCFCYMQYPVQQDDYHLFAYPDSNGGAAGNSIEEAVLQGFLELVERDSAALWWYNMLRKPAVDLFSFDEPYFIQLIEYYNSINRSLYVLDITTDLQIPSFVAVSHCMDHDKKDDIVFGYGTHVDAEIGVERALIEVNQLLPVISVTESGRASGKYRTQDKPVIEWLNNATMENQPYFVPLKNVPGKKYSDYPRLCEPNIYDSLMFCIHTAEKHGLETLVLDLTRPDLMLNVAKVIVPGLRHFWKRLAPGRLYDVPVKMGWLKAPLKEEELNPISMFL